MEDDNVQLQTIPIKKWSKLRCEEPLTKEEKTSYKLIEYFFNEGIFGEEITSAIGFTDSDVPFFFIFLAKYDDKNTILVLKKLRELYEKSICWHDDDCSCPKPNFEKLVKKTNLKHLFENIYPGDFNISDPLVDQERGDSDHYELDLKTGRHVIKKNCECEEGSECDGSECDGSECDGSECDGSECDGSECEDE